MCSRVNNVEQPPVETAAVKGVEQQPVEAAVVEGKAEASESSNITKQ